MSDRDETIQKLMNRLQAGDLRTLVALDTKLETPTTDYHSTHDLKELEVLSHGQGLGIGIYDDGTRDDDEFAAFSEELGIPYEQG